MLKAALKRYLIRRTLMEIRLRRILQPTKKVGLREYFRVTGKL